MKKIMIVVLLSITGFVAQAQENLLTNGRNPYYDELQYHLKLGDFDFWGDTFESVVRYGIGKFVLDDSLAAFKTIFGEYIDAVDMLKYRLAIMNFIKENKEKIEEKYDITICSIGDKSFKFYPNNIEELQAERAERLKKEAEEKQRKISESLAKIEL